jgi:hypothetical protein
MCDAFGEMRPFWLMAAFVVLVFIDLSLAPLAVLLIWLGGIFGSLGVGEWTGLVMVAVAIAAVPVALTIIVGKALRRARATI